MKGGIAPGDPCPHCGGVVVVDVDRSYKLVPVLRDGYDTNLGKIVQDDEGDPYCMSCEKLVLVDWEKMVKWQHADN